MSYAFSAFALVVIIAIITFLFKNGIHEFRFLLSEFMMSSVSYLLSGFSFINYVKSPSSAPILSPITVGGFVWLGGAFSAPAALQPYPIHYQRSYDSQTSSFFIKNLRQENYSIYWPHSNLMTPSILYENSRGYPSLRPTIIDQQTCQLCKTRTTILVLIDSTGNIFLHVFPTVMHTVLISARFLNILNCFLLPNCKL